MLRIIIYIVIAVLVLSFFGISIPGIIESPTGQENIQYVWNLIVLAGTWLWNLIRTVIDLLIFWK